MKFIQAFKWSTINSFVIHLLQLIFSILFARLLQPKDFGLIAIILAITAFLRVFIDNGLGAFLIYKDDPDQIDKSSIFWINLLIGIFVAAILIISSQFVSSFYNEPLLQILSYFFAFELIIASFSIVQIALFRKERNFKKIFLAQVTGLISSSLVCLFLAIKGYGVWSLVIRSLTMALISVIMIWYFGKWKPDFNLSFGRLKKMFSYSIPLLLSNIIGYATKNIDYIIIGKILGSTNLGFYQKGYQFASLPGNQIVEIMGTLMFSSFSRIKSKKDDIWKYFIDISKVVTFISVFAALSIFFLADSFVINILGEHWRKTIPILQNFFFLIVFLPHHRLAGSIFYTMNATKTEFKINLYLLPLYILIIPVSKLGLDGVAIYISLIIVINFLVRVFFATKLLKKSLLNYLIDLKTIFIDGLIVFLIFYLFDLHFINHWTWLIIGPVIIIALMILSRLIFFKSETVHLLKTIRSKVNGK